MRGVNIDGVLQTLMERGLVKIAGRAEIPGRPLLYETTQFFLDHFGLRNLDELPNAEELRRRYLPVAQPVTPARRDRDSARVPRLVIGAALTTNLCSRRPCGRRDLRMKCAHRGHASQHARRVRYQSDSSLALIASSRRPHLRKSMRRIASVLQNTPRAGVAVRCW